MCDICEPTGKTWKKISEDKGKIRTNFHCTSVDFQRGDLVSNTTDHQNLYREVKKEVLLSNIDSNRGTFGISKHTF